MRDGFSVWHEQLYDVTLLCAPKSRTFFVLERAKDLPTICQINMELHTPPKSYGYDLGDFYDHFINLLLDARYMPMHIEISGPAKFLRVFMLNIKDSDCTSKFLC